MPHNTNDFFSTLLYIVHDRFLDLSSEKMIFTTSQIKQAMYSNNIKKSYYTPLSVVFGLGVNTNQVQDCKDVLQRITPGKDLTYIDISNMHPEAPDMVNTNYKKDVLITTVHCKNGEYKSFLVIDPSCRYWIDHVSGNHIQGSLLYDAILQFAHSIYHKRFTKKNICLTILNSSVNYISMVLPFPVTLSGQIKILNDVAYINIIMEQHAKIVLTATVKVCHEQD